MKAKLMICLMALSVALAGYVSCLIASQIHWGHGWITAPALLPGLSFGLVTAGWMLHRKWIGRGKAVGLVVGSAVAYFAAYWTALYNLAFCGEGMIFSRSQLPLFHVGMIGGVIGTVLLVASLAAVSPDFRSKNWKTLIIIGTAAGGALCLAGIGAKSFDHAGSLANPGDRVFIVVWQLLVSGYIGVLLFGAPSLSSGPSERGRIALWARRAVWALLLVSVIHAAIGYSRREKESTAASSATSGSSAAQPSTKLDADATAWANEYRNAKFITWSEFLKNVGPVYLVVRQRSGVSECVPDLEKMVREAAVKHGWTLSSSPTDVGLVIDADINRSKITTTEYTNWGAREQEGYHMAYIASFQFGFVTQGYCRRGDKFVQVDAFPLWGARFSNDCMGDLVDFKANYREAFEQAVDGVFNDLAESGKSDNTDNDDEAAWAASLWPKARDAEMAKSFLSALNSEARGSNRIFTGVSRFTVVPVDFAEEGSEELDAHSIEESWTSELNRNGYEVDAAAEVRIKTFAGAWRRSGIGVPGYYVNESFVRVQQNNVVFRFNGQLRRRRAYIWSTLNTAIALPREQSDTARKLMDESIRSAAKEFALRR